jgi:DNA repair exonuclease SbcCD ATPase subunit
MRLLSARVRDYRLHRNCSVDFDSRFTVIAGPNQSGKSTLAEALHRALFLPVKTGGELLKGMQTDPFLNDPEVELCFEAAGQPWQLRKRFAGSRGSVSLRDAGGRSLQGDAAEERLAELIGTAAVPRNRGAADQLRERWGHLWVWQGSASTNPLELGGRGYDHDRLVERLQAGADLGIQSPLDLAVIDSIEVRYGEVFTAGGANRAPQVKRGSPLQLARAATEQAREALATIQVRIDQQAEAEAAFHAALEQLERLAVQIPELQRERGELEQQLTRSRELEAAIGQEEPILTAALKEHGELSRDLQQLIEQARLVSELEAAREPDTRKLEALRQQQPALETARAQTGEQLEALQASSLQAAQAVTAIETRQERLRLRLRQSRSQAKLASLEQLTVRRGELERHLALLPPISAADVEALRRLETALGEARVRAESLATGIEVIRAGQPVRLDGEDLPEGSSHLLTQRARLQVGDDVELRLLPGGGTSVAEASGAVEAAEQALARALQRWKVGTVEEAATVERRRSDLQAERERLLEQAGPADADTLRREIQAIAAALAAQPDDPQAWPADPSSDDAAQASETLEARLAQLDRELQQVRKAREEAGQAERDQRGRLDGAAVELEAHRQAIATAEQALLERDNQLLEARTRMEAVLERRCSQEALQAAVAAAEQQREASQSRLQSLQADLAALGADALRTQAQALEQSLATLTALREEASEARIRAEGRLHGDGQVDLHAEMEQKQAALESALAEEERLEKEAAMLRLLRRLLEEEQNAMGSEYSAPLTERIGRYLGEVFPEAPQPGLSYDARGGGFQKLQWRRGDEAVFGFEVLSTGAREQFAAALRVAMAEVLAEAYDGSLPVLFDDAFANSDPERQEGIHRMLQQAADQGLQVILLTCDPERSERIATARQIRLDR